MPAKLNNLKKQAEIMQKEGYTVDVYYYEFKQNDNAPTIKISCCLRLQDDGAILDTLKKGNNKARIIINISSDFIIRGGLPREQYDDLKELLELEINAGTGNYQGINFRLNDFLEECDQALMPHYGSPPAWSTVERERASRITETEDPLERVTYNTIRRDNHDVSLINFLKSAYRTDYNTAIAYKRDHIHTCWTRDPNLSEAEYQVIRQEMLNAMDEAYATLIETGDINMFTDREW